MSQDHKDQALKTVTAEQNTEVNTPNGLKVASSPGNFQVRAEPLASDMGWYLTCEPMCLHQGHPCSHPRWALFLLHFHSLSPFPKLTVNTFRSNFCLTQFILPIRILLFSRPIVSNSMQPRCIAACQTSLSLTISRHLLIFVSFHLWCHPDISSSDAVFSFCPQSFLASGTFPMSRLFASDDQNTRASASASVLPMSVQDWFPSRLTGVISLLSKGSGVFSSTVWRHQFFGAQSRKLVKWKWTARKVVSV